MKVHVAVMMDKDRMADHNFPSVVVAADLPTLGTRIREYIIANSWHINMPNEKEDLTEADVRTMDMDDLMEAMDGECNDEGYAWSIHEEDL